MLDHIIKFSIKNKLIIGVLVLALIGWGVYSAKELPIDALPDITNNQVQIITSAPSQSAQDIERLVTFPIEMTMSNIPDVEEIRSFSRFGLSVVTIVFKESVDVYWARQQISERIAQVKNKIPEGIGSPEMMPVTTGLGEIYQYTLHAQEGYKQKYNPMELRSLQDWVVRRQLLGLEGVADVSSLGGFLKQYEVALKPERLMALNVTIKDVFEALGKSNQNTGGAYIDQNPKAYFIRSEGLIKNLDDIKNIVIKNMENGTPILIRDIGKVQFGTAVRYGAMTRNDDGDAVGGIVMMLKGANASKVIKVVKERVLQIQKSLPEGVVLEPFLDRTKLVDKAIKTVSTNLIEGALIVIFILVLLLGNFRASLIVASVIPLSMLFAIALMNLFGVSGNLMSLGAIDFGIIVDGSIIIVEATLHHLGMRKRKEKLTQDEMDEEVHTSASNIRTSAAFGEIIILIVYLPILGLVGIEGKMFKPMAMTVSFAIIGAFILSLTYVPMISALFLSKKIRTKKNFSEKIIDAIHKVYQPILDFVLKNGKKVIVFTLLIFGFSLFTFSRMGSEFIPTLDEGDFAAQMMVTTGSSVNYTVEATTQASQILLREFTDEVIEVVGKIGSSEIPTDPMPMEASDIMILLSEPKEWTKADSKEELAEKMQKILEKNMVGVTFGFQQPIQMRFNELMTGARQDVVLKIYGEDLNKLVEYGNKLSQIIPTVAGASDLYVEKISGLKQIVVNYKREQLARYGLHIEDVNTLINTAFAGQSAGFVFEGEKRYDLVVRMQEKDRNSIDDIKKMYIPTEDGNQIPLTSVASVTLKDSPNQIQRDDAKRRITVGFNVRGRDVASIVKELKQKIESQLKFDTGYYVTYGGTFENLEKARDRLLVAVPIALLLIFLLLYITFKSVKQSILIFTSIPMSAIGGIFALWIRDMPFSISAGIGFIALFGVAVLNGIVLISEFNRLKATGITDILEIIKQGTATRLRPVIMTALVASVGFLPMALATSAGAEVQKPLATVVVGGLISATLLTLLILPLLYMFFEKKSFIKINTNVVAVLVLFFGISQVNAQVKPNVITEQQAINLALSKSVVMNDAKLHIDMQKADIAGAFELAPLSLEYRNVKVNPATVVREMSVNQNFGSVLGYIKRKKLAKSKVALATVNLGISKKEVTKNVRSLYQEWHYLYALKKLLDKQQENVRKIKTITEKLYQSGEIGGLENDITILQSLRIKSQKTSIYKKYSQVENKLKSLLQLNIAIQPKSEFPEALDFVLSDKPSSIFAKAITETNKVATDAVSLAKSTYFPEFTAGLINRKAGDAKGFLGFMVGLEIPLPFGSNKASIKKQEIRRAEIAFENNVAKIEIQNTKESLASQLIVLKKEIDTINKIFEKAKKFVEKLSIAYKSGEIDVYKYNQSFDTYFEVMQNYLALIQTYNQTVIEYEYYLD